MTNVKSMAQARQRIKEAQARANEERAKRERDNVEDAAVVMVELGRIAAVDTWEADQLRAVRVEADRRRDERRGEAAVALRRMQDRGETLAAITHLVGVPQSELRALTKVTSTRTPSAPDSDAANGARVDAELGSGRAAEAAVSDALGELAEGGVPTAAGGQGVDGEDDPAQALAPVIHGVGDRGGAG